MELKAVTAGRWGKRQWQRTVRGSTLRGPIFAVKVYTATPRADGTYTWKLTQTLSTSYTVLSSAEEAAKKVAAEMCLPYVPNLKQGTLLGQVVL